MTDMPDRVTPILRPAIYADWPAIWPILRAVASAGETYTYPRDLTEPMARTLWRPQTPGIVLVAEDDDDMLLGSAKVGANQMGPGAHVATASFIVDEPARGRGVGRMLGQAAIDWARDAGFRAMQFNAVVASNTAAVSLWQSLGFVVVGIVPEAFHRPNGDYADLLVMHRTL